MYQVSSKSYSVVDIYSMINLQDFITICSVIEMICQQMYKVYSNS